MPINIIISKNVELVCDRCGTNGNGMMNGEEVVLLDGWEKSNRVGEEVICGCCATIEKLSKEELFESVENLLSSNYLNSEMFRVYKEEILNRMSY